MRNGRYYGVMVSMLLLVAGGCKRGSIPEPPEKALDGMTVPVAGGQAVPVAPTIEPPTPVPDAVDTPDGQPVTSADQVRILNDEEATIAVRAITNIEARGLRVGVVGKQTGKSVLLSLGHEFEGHKLIGYEAAKDMIIFLWNGEKVGLFLSASPAASSGSGAEPAVIGPGAGMVVDENGMVIDDIPMGAPPDRIDLRDVETENFTPTQKEREAGIDPNDADTWPEGYRGPVIERLIEKQREAGIEPETAPPGIFPPAGP